LVSDSIVAWEELPWDGQEQSFDQILMQQRFAFWRATAGMLIRRGDCYRLPPFYEGLNRKDAAILGGMDRQTLRDWVLRFNDKGPDGLLNQKPSGRKPRLSKEQLKDLERLVETGPDLEKDGVVRWRAIDLKRVIEARFGVRYGERHVMKLLNGLGFSHISVRPKHPMQDARVIDAFKKTSIKP